MGVSVKRVYVLVAVGVAALVVASAALGGGSLVSSYGGQAQQALVKTSSAAKPAQAQAPAQAKASGTLPFTGLDLGVFVVAGGALVLTGVALRRFGRQKS